MAKKAYFGMDTLYVSNGNDAPTHYNTKIVDIAGLDSSAEPFYAPFDCIVKEIRNDWDRGNWIVYQSLEPVITPASYPHAVDISMRLTHIDAIRDIKDIFGEDIKKGSICAAGSKIYQEGSSGRADGNHIHIEFKMGRYRETVDFTNSLGILVSGMVTDMDEGPIDLRLDEALFLKYGQKVKISNRDIPANYYTYTLEGGEKATAIFLATHGTNPNSYVTSSKEVESEK